MVEAGGPATQAGIRYQDQVAALYLGRMLDPRERPRHDQPVELRIEAPQDVDDFVVRFADGSRQFFQVKRSLEAKGAVWKDLWLSIRRQVGNNFTPDDRIQLILGEPSRLATNLRSLCERRTGSDPTEWLSRLTIGQRQVIQSIQKLLTGDTLEVWRILGLLDVSVWGAPEVERDFVPHWMPPSSVPSARLFRALSEMAWEGAAVRTRFDGPTLYERLRSEAGIFITDPSNWGSAKYRDAIASLATIEVPGTNFKQIHGTAYLWPKCFRYEQGRVADFDDDLPGWRDSGCVAEVDLESFPSADLRAVVVVAGPGFGKTTLVQELARKAALSSLLPVIIPIPKLAESDLSIAEYLAERINSEFDIHVDWPSAASTGALVLLLDGLDEVSSDRRTLVLERLRVYRSSHPNVPWLMTVRDASALVAPGDAKMIELAPLDDVDLQRYVDFYRPTEAEVGTKLLGRVAARPDLAQMVRIPIFLALMLVLHLEDKDLRRSELLDIYLETLFRPEAFKAAQADGLDTSTLRRIAERSAFEALETDTIGVSIKQLEQCVKATDATLSTDRVREALVKRGVLRSASLVRLAFPFPIVQEYLASTELLEQHGDQLGRRLSLIARRPWAQTIQFALERHPGPSSLIENVLAREDDVFHTGLRLLGRCLSNGMAVTQAQWHVLGERLSSVWGTMPWQASRLVDGIVVDVLAQPLHPAVRARLAERSLIHHGTGRILVRRQDSVLSMEVLTTLLKGNLEHLWHLGEFQVELDRLGTDAFNLYISHARENQESKADREAISSLIGHMKQGCVDAEVAFKAAGDESLPLEVRLSAFCHSRMPLDVAMEKLVKQAFTVEGYSPRAAAARALASPLIDISTVLRLIRGSSAHGGGDSNPLDYVINFWGKAERPKKLAELMAAKGIRKDERHLALLYAVNGGDGVAFDCLLEDLGVMDAKMVAATVVLFGHLPERTRVQRAVRDILARTWLPEDRCLIAGSLVIGMTYRMDMVSMSSGSLHNIPPHPGRSAAVRLFEEWMSFDDYEPWSRLKLVSDAAKLGAPGAIDFLEPTLDRALATPPLEESSAGSLAGDVLETLYEQGRPASLDQLELFAIKGSYNLASQAIKLIARGGTTLQAESLIRLYEKVRRDLRSNIVGALEPLAGRLGLRIVRVEGRLVTSVP